MCRCFSVATLKWLIYASCLILLGIGSVIVWIGFLVQSSSFVQLLQYTYAGFIVISCGGLLIFIAFIGIIGAWKQRRIFLSLFIISSIIIGILLITFGGVLIYVRQISNEYLKSEYSCTQHFQDADQTSVLASKVFCKLYCPCTLDENTAKQLNIQNFYKGSAGSVQQCNPCESIQTYDPSVQEDLIDWLDQNLKIKVNTSDCAIVSSDYSKAYFNSKYQSYFPLIKWMETQWSCSGLCTAQNIQFFSDVTVQLPTGSCYNSIKQWSQNEFLSYGIVSIVLGIYQISIIYFEIALCFCHKRRIKVPPEVTSTTGKTVKDVD